VNPQLFLINLLIQIIFGSFILGLIILVAIPGFRLTIPDLLVFVLGATPGCFILQSFLQPTLVERGVFTNKTVTQENQVVNIEFFFGALIGGITLVLLKMLLLKALGKSERPRKTYGRK